MRFSSIPEEKDKTINFPPIAVQFKYQLLTVWVATGNSGPEKADLKNLLKRSRYSSIWCLQVFLSIKKKKYFFLSIVYVSKTFCPSAFKHKLHCPSHLQNPPTSPKTPDTRKTPSWHWRAGRKREGWKSGGKQHTGSKGETTTTTARYLLLPFRGERTWTKWWSLTIFNILQKHHLHL